MKCSQGVQESIHSSIQVFFAIQFLHWRSRIQAIEGIWFKHSKSIIQTLDLSIMVVWSSFKILCLSSRSIHSPFKVDSKHIIMEVLDLHLWFWFTLLSSRFHINIFIYISNTIAYLLNIIASLLDLLLLLASILYFNSIIKVDSKPGFDQGKPIIQTNKPISLQV